jgi:hypothetical protein
MVPRKLTTKVDDAIVRIFIGFKVRRPPRAAPLPAHAGTQMGGDRRCQSARMTGESRTSSKKADHTRSSDLMRSLFSTYMDYNACKREYLWPNGKLCHSLFRRRKASPLVFRNHSRRGYEGQNQCVQL